MKDFKDTLDSIYRKSDALAAKKNRRTAMIKRISFSVSGLCAAVIVGFGIWNSDIIRSGMEDKFTNPNVITDTTEAVTTAITAANIVTTATTSASTAKPVSTQAAAEESTVNLTSVMTSAGSSTAAVTAVEPTENASPETTEAAQSAENTTETAAATTETQPPTSTKTITAATLTTSAHTIVTTTKTPPTTPLPTTNTTIVQTTAVTTAPQTTTTTDIPHIPSGGGGSGGEPSGGGAYAPPQHITQICPFFRMNTTDGKEKIFITCGETATVSEENIAHYIGYELFQYSIDSRSMKEYGYIMAVVGYDSDAVVAVKFANHPGYYLYINNDYTPASFGDWFTVYNTDYSILTGEAIYYYPSSRYKVFSDIDVQFIADELSKFNDLSQAEDYTPIRGIGFIEIKFNIPELNTTGCFNITENGYLLISCRAGSIQVFIGEEKACEIIRKIMLDKK